MEKTGMHKHWRRVVMAAATAALLAGPARAAIPKTALIEGVLTSTGGGAAADGVYEVTFRIYDKDVGGTELWSESTKIQTTGGRFTHALGSVKPLDVPALAAKGGRFVGLRVKGEPEMPRAELHSSLFARWAAAAGKLQCAGCIGATQIAGGAVGGTKVGFNYAGSDTKGGSALKAKALSCTGCVTVAQLKFDQDVDLGAKNLKTTGTIAAKQFLGDGSQLTGIKTPAGTCSKTGEVVRGIDANGQLICVKAMDPSALPGNGLNEISNQALSNEFNDTITGGQNKPIPDFNSNGLLDTITVPDIGNADSFEVYIEITKEPFDDNKPADGKPDWDTTDLTVMLFAPTTKALKSPRSNYVSGFTSKPTVDQKLYPHYVLHQQTGKGFLKLVATYPTQTKPVFGDIHKDWLGKNPKGRWQLLILDNKDRVDNKTGKDLALDGKLVSWHIKMSTTSGNQVLASGQQFVNGKLWGKYLGHDNVQKGGTLGGPLQVGGDLEVGGKITGDLTVGKPYITIGGKKLWYGMFPEGSTPFLLGWRWDGRQNNWQYDRPSVNSPWEITDNIGYLKPRIDRIVYGDKYGNISRVWPVSAYNDGADDSNLILVAFIRNTTGKPIKHPVCYRASYRDNSRRGGFAMNGSNIWYSSGNGIQGGHCPTVTFPANKRSILVVKSGCYYWAGWGNFEQHSCVAGFYGNRLAPAGKSSSGLPKGLVWDYARYWDFATNSY